jgi:hypothetical protein
VSFKNVTVLDAHGVDVPVDVYNAISAYWHVNGLGNDYTYVEWYGYNGKYQIITDYIKEMGENPEDGSVLIHFWW